jgi:carboxypeptidase C (cathepsin A)
MYGRLRLVICLLMAALCAAGFQAARAGSTENAAGNHAGVEGAATPSGEHAAAGAGEAPGPLLKLSVTRHTYKLPDGGALDYTATAGYMRLKDEAQKPRADIFFVAYTVDGRDKVSRPLTFLFNGGPGASSAWLHMGVAGPMRVITDGDKPPAGPPYAPVHNPYSWLPWTDLVFIDPVSTGYSRPLPGERAKVYHGFRKDIESVGDFIRLYTTRFRRWSSPKFLAGESYGTTRAAGLSGYLQDRHGMYLNGMILISVVLDFMTLLADPGNELPYVLFLPTYTATAWYHHKLQGKLQDDLETAVAQSREFAMGTYAAALLKGAALTNEERAAVVARLAALTGLSPDYIDRTNLRIHDHRFTKELLRSERQTIGRIDSRYKGADRDAAGEFYEFDPSMAATMGPFTGVFYDYVRSELNYESDLPYEVLNAKVWPWRYDDFENRYLNVAETLRKAMAVNPNLKLYVANGYFDLATPFLATEYTFTHLGMEEALRKNVTMSYFPAGHMMYVQLASLARLHEELVAFIRGVTA